MRISAFLGLIAVRPHLTTCCEYTTCITCKGPGSGGPQPILLVLQYVCLPHHYNLLCNNALVRLLSPIMAHVPGPHMAVLVQTSLIQ
jgi:hypothetical protein